VGVAAVGEVGVVREVDGPGDHFAVDEDRFGEHDVGQMGAAALVGVVAAEHIARAHFGARVALHDVRDQVEEAAQVHRDMLSLAQGFSVEVEQRRGAVAAFLDVGGVGGADQRLAHFLDDGGQCAADDLDRDGIDHAAASRTRLR